MTPAVPVVVLMAVVAAEPVVPLVAKPLGVTAGPLALMVGVVAAPVRVPEHLARPDMHRRGPHVPGMRPHVHRRLHDPGRATLDANREVNIGACLGHGGGAKGRDSERDNCKELGVGEEVHGGWWSCEEVILRGPP